MKQGVLTHGQVRLLLSKGHSCYRRRRTGERKRKSVWGCIVNAKMFSHTNTHTNSVECFQFGHHEKRGEGYSWTH